MKKAKHNPIPDGHVVHTFTDPTDISRVIQIVHKAGKPRTDAAVIFEMREIAKSPEWSVRRKGMELYSDNDDAVAIARTLEFKAQRVPRQLVSVTVYFAGKPSNVLSLDGVTMEKICDAIVAIDADLVSADDVMFAHIRDAWSPMPW